MGDCVLVYRVLLGVLSRRVVWLMWCVFNQTHAPSPEGKKRNKNKKLQQNKTKTRRAFSQKFFWEKLGAVLVCSRKEICQLSVCTETSCIFVCSNVGGLGL